LTSSVLKLQQMPRFSTDKYTKSLWQFKV